MQVPFAGVSLQRAAGARSPPCSGSNGAGKTTILKTISGIIDPRKGSVTFKGDDITAHGSGAHRPARA
jgi:branched-chain amino acid transport system ATP-binding protein